jgi:hypothetical protein
MNSANTDEDPGLWIGKLCRNKFAWFFHKQNITYFIAMQTYKELINCDIIFLTVYPNPPCQLSRGGNRRARPNPRISPEL